MSEALLQYITGQERRPVLLEEDAPEILNAAQRALLDHETVSGPTQHQFVRAMFRSFDTEAKLLARAMYGLRHLASVGDKISARATAAAALGDVMVDGGQHRFTGQSQMPPAKDVDHL